jgi:DNA-binding NarL/FixJ family response regulator
VDKAADWHGPMIRVVVADDQALVRVGCRTLLEAEDDIEVVGEAETGVTALELIKVVRPDVVLMDIRMPGLSGLDATRAITADPDLKAVRILILTTFELDEYVFEALRAGASGFLLKDVDPEELVRAVRLIAGGEALLSPAVTRTVISQFVSTPERLAASPAQLRVLTEREREILGVLATGLSNDEIAERLVISPATVRTHVNRVMTKLAARDRAQLVVMAYEAGLVAPGRHD